MGNILGKKEQLLQKHGTVDVERCIYNLLSKSGEDTLNINEINASSKLGQLFILESGKILDDCSDKSESRAKYKLVPTGLYVKDTKYPIFASFLKFDNEHVWKGAYFGTGEQLFNMYKEHYFDPTCFDFGYINVFCNSGVYTDIIGFGLKEVLQNAKKEKEKINEVIDTDPIGNSLKAAIDKCIAEAKSQDNTAKGRRAAKKSLDKANMLQQRLDKMEAKANKKAQLQEKTENTERNTDLEISNNVEESIGVDEKQEQKEINEVEENGLEVASENNQNSKETIEQQLCGNMNAKFVKKLYSRMLYKEKWMTNGGRRLDFYIKSLVNLLESERKSSGNKPYGNGYTYSKDRSKCVLNLGIFDIYGNDIYILDSTPDESDFKIKQLSIVNSKVDLMQEGFTQDELKKLPTTFDLSKYHKDCIFNANIEDFDFMDSVRLNHIIEERRDRFPDKYKNEPSRILCEKLREAIKMAVKISKTDCRYIIPKYDFQRKKIQFMVPFHLDNDLQDIPELAIIIGKNKDIWCIHTIISMDDAIADARILFRTTSWLRDTI